ncbi:hypothetical protein EJ02DRAFT_459629 [Clathrospora elynae]|uniref:Uncharacterized protein n=1 Tax=Clathrospora elynae TaxID=706981 RepID=A0A6A5S8H8_9PLEO|nr:hypothetical protein EJ02DRAFT_459629 [Clathrospora elynae]
MGSISTSAEAIAAIIFGLLQLVIGIVSLWQQRQLRRAYREYCLIWKPLWLLTSLKGKETIEGDIQFDLSDHLRSADARYVVSGEG